MSRRVERSGYRPSPYDGRDFIYQATGTGGGTIKMLGRPTLRDQGQLACCVSMALVAAMEIVAGDNVALSPLYHWYGARRDPHSLGAITLRTGLDAAAEDGVCRHPLHDPPPTAEGARLEPSEAADSDAKQRAVAGFDPIFERFRYYRLDGTDRVQAWKEALYDGLPVLIGFWTDDTYWDGRGMPIIPTGPSYEAHAAVVIGFSDLHQQFTVLDSRGTRLTPDGEWQLSYDAARSGAVVESWTFEDVIPTE